MHLDAFFIIVFNNKHSIMLYMVPETHKELKRVTRVHSVQIFSLPSTIFGNTKSLYANDLHTQRHTQQNFRFCDKSFEFRPKRRKLFTETKEIH